MSLSIYTASHSARSVFDVDVLIRLVSGPPWIQGIDKFPFGNTTTFHFRKTENSHFVEDVKSLTFDELWLKIVFSFATFSPRAFLFVDVADLWRWRVKEKLASRTRMLVTSALVIQRMSFATLLQFWEHGSAIICMYASLYVRMYVRAIIYMFWSAVKIMCKLQFT